MDTEKLTGFDRISGKNGLFPPVLPVRAAFSFPVCWFAQRITVVLVCFCVDEIDKFNICLL